MQSALQAESWLTWDQRTWILKEKKVIRTGQPKKQSSASTPSTFLNRHCNSSSASTIHEKSMIPIAVNAKHIDLSCVSLLILNMITDLIPWTIDLTQHQLQGCSVADPHWRGFTTTKSHGLWWMSLSSGSRSVYPKARKKINGLKLKLKGTTKKNDIEDLNKGFKTFESDIKKLKYWGVKVYDVGKYYIYLQWLTILLNDHILFFRRNNETKAEVSPQLKHFCQDAWREQLGTTTLLTGQVHHPLQQE
jgi:hypothetical protein